MLGACAMYRTLAEFTTTVGGRSTILRLNDRRYCDELSRRELNVESSRVESSLSVETKVKITHSKHEHMGSRS